MGNRARLRITGINELRRAVKEYGEALVSAAQAAANDAMDNTIAEARAAAPVETGALRDSIVGTLTLSAHSARGTVKAKAPHAHLIELGTQRIKPHPFLVPAAIRNRRKMTEALAAAQRTLAPDGLGTPRITGAGPAMPGVSVDDEDADAL